MNGPGSGAYRESVWRANLDLVEAGLVIGGDLRPSSDTPTHLALYRRFPDIGGVVHTHSREATAWAQACRPIPPLGTTHADHFNGAVPVTRQLRDDEIVETLDLAGLGALDMPAVLVAWHGPFTWGSDARAAAANAVALELVAGMARRTLALDPEAQPMTPSLLERH